MIKTEDRIGYRLSVVSHQLIFRQPAGTSRGVYTTRQVWYIIISSKSSPWKWGIGECAPLPDLSIDALPDYENILNTFCRRFEEDGILDKEALRPYPSILFGLETAIQHLEKGSFALWDTSFSKGKTGIPINGLIWMGSYSQMLEQVEAKMAAGYRCIKLKIGAIDFEEELKLIGHIRNHYTSDQIEIRVDANGAFSPEDAMDKLRRLAELDLHSIEQPIKANQWNEMARLTASTPLPIALDEELIGSYSPKEKRKLLETIHPQYIILKPSLHGGLNGCAEWIEEAERLNIGWWITSALESNVGLNAIAQWTATHKNTLPQGLGTGQLFTDNIEMPLFIRKDSLWFDPEVKVESFFSEWFNDSPFVTVQTSGSTGTPKQITVRKEQMINSARITTSFLHLQPRDNALLCMPVKFIAGKMMLVRSIIAGLNLITRPPSLHPLADVTEPICLAAMTPMQVYNSLLIDEEAERLKQIKNLLIGGGPIDAELQKQLYSFPNAVYITYGMTETVSHIALRRLNGPEASEYYTPFPSVQLSLSREGTLVIDAPLIADHILTTNDIAELLPDGRFRILGRKDNVINSGGIKIQIEEVENALRTIISSTFAVTSVVHPELGEAMVLLIEKDAESKQELKNKISQLLSKYHQPKYIIETNRIPLTDNGKTDRSACKQRAAEWFDTHL